MSTPELAQLALLADVDTLLADVVTWSDQAPPWPPARAAQTLVKRMLARANALRVRWEAPLAVATLGGTGTGKSTLVNALCGDEVTSAGRQRPTTQQPQLICRAEVELAELGIDPRSVDVVHRELAALRDLVLVDCPDPDTTEDESAPAGTNLARMRALLPHCDVLLVTSTQQKYRDARLIDELATAAPGARLVFVQTHADLDDDIRADWRRALGPDYEAGEMFFLDARAAWEAARIGQPPSGEFGRLVELLARELAGAAGQRIRRENFLDLVAESLAACRARLDEGLPAIDQLEAAIREQRVRLAARLSEALRDELSASRRPWETRLLAEVTSRWGLSPFSAVLRTWQALGGLLTSTLLLRARTPAQVALWGAVEGGRVWKRRRTDRQADDATTRMAQWSWDESDLRTASIILEGYAAEAALPRGTLDLDQLTPQAQQAAQGFLAQTAGELQGLVRRLAQRQSPWWTRAAYEAAFGALLAIVLLRLGKNFFYDSWLATQPTELYDLKFFVHATLWILLWSACLLALFLARLRRGLQREIALMASRWQQAHELTSLFAPLEQQCRAAHRCRDDLARLEQRVHQTRQKLQLTSQRLGHRRGAAAAPLASGD